MSEVKIGSDSPRWIIWRYLSEEFVEASEGGVDLEAEWKVASALSLSDMSIDDLDQIAKREFCSGMAWVALGAVASGGFAIPTYQFDEKELWLRMEFQCRASRRLRVNPVWWVGYLLARWFVSSRWSRLMTCVEEIRQSR